MKKILDTNPYNLLIEMEKAIHDGWRVSSSVRGAPVLASQLKTVMLFSSKDDQSYRDYESTIEGDSVVVSEYNPTVFLMKVQDAILQGFEVVEDGFSFLSAKTVKLVRKQATPAKEPPVVVAQAEQPVTQIEPVVDVEPVEEYTESKSESVVETPSEEPAPKRRGRKKKQSEE